MTEMEIQSMIARLDERSMSMDEKLDSILEQTKKTNGRVTVSEKNINDIQSWQSNSDSHWRGVYKTVAIAITVITIFVGAIATYLWH